MIPSKREMRPMVLGSSLSLWGYHVNWASKATTIWPGSALLLVNRASQLQAQAHNPRLKRAGASRVGIRSRDPWHLQGLLADGKLSAICTRPLVTPLGSA